VVAADIYSVPPHTGRGGWTWYTGSAGWMYRLGLEAILGLRRAGDAFSIDPCIPPAWPGYELVYTIAGARYEICVENPAHVSRGVRQVILDEEALPDGKIPISNDSGLHVVRIVMG
jgi:cellobiose phosphorylase